MLDVVMLARMQWPRRADAGALLLRVE